MATMIRFIRSPGSSAIEIDHLPAAYPRREQVVEGLRQRVERDAAHDPVEVPGLEIRREPPPDAQLRLDWIVDVHPEQPYPSQNERQDVAFERAAARVADGGDRAAALHGAREPFELLAADRVHRASPGLLLERLGAVLQRVPVEHFCRP